MLSAHVPFLKNVPLLNDGSFPTLFLMERLGFFHYVGFLSVRLRKSTDTNPLIFTKIKYSVHVVLEGKQ